MRRCWGCAEDVAEPKKEAGGAAQQPVQLESVGRDNDMLPSRRGTGDDDDADVARMRERDELMDQMLRRMDETARFPRKTVAMAVTLLCAGVALTLIGLFTALAGADRDRALACLILGGICLVPGAYHSYILYAIWKRKKGYNATLLREYDDS